MIELFWYALIGAFVGSFAASYLLGLKQKPDQSVKPAPRIDTAKAARFSSDAYRVQKEQEVRHTGPRPGDG